MIEPEMHSGVFFFAVNLDELVKSPLAWIRFVVRYLTMNGKSDT